VKFVFRHYAFLGEESRRAAEAAECANDQGRFWPYHDLLFANQAGENTGAFADDRLKAFASQLALDQARFNQCLDSRQHRAEIDAAVREATAQGIPGTPTVFVSSGGAQVRLGNPLDFAEIQRAVEAALDRVGQ
jgi:protein-disulfide isomerase